MRIENFRCTAVDLEWLIDELGALAKHAQHTWRRGVVDTEWAEVALRQYVADGQVYVVNGVIVIADVITEWFSSKPILSEVLVYRASWSRKNTAHDVPRFLVELARHHGCYAVLAGDTNMGRMLPHYEAAGFHCIGKQYIFKLNEDNHGT